ncbi:retrovirus-related pol polyprotein from transposon TNT 1-94 [Tanacetum coccineum]|uniref:Retrovirus-related pol polyprotein from transposon TNT 1-94 n=1 Tax=Tanacetum coccineum TaxID=301880 RepID=A0ABQ5GRC8_9ASTR
MLAPKCSTYNGRPTFANPRYLKKAQSEKPCLYEIPYDTSDLAKGFAIIGRGLMTLANESRSKLNKDYVKPYDYTRQNSLYEIFKAPSLEYLYQLERAKEVRKTMWRKNECSNCTTTTQIENQQLPHCFRNTNPHVSKSSGVNHTTSVSRPQLKCYQVKDKVVPNNSQVKFEEGKLYQLILFIVDSGCTKHMTGNLKLLCNFVEKFLGTVHFGNDQFAPILGYGDLNQGNIMIKRVYYVEGLNHNLFSVGQFCDADLEVAFRKSTCFVRDLQGNDLLTGNRGSDLYTISLQETTSSTPICFMAKASPTQAWLWHRRLSHLNFDYITLLSKKDIVTGLPKLKYVKDQLCSSCEMSKAKRSSFKSKVVPSSKGRLNLLHMDLCGPMRVASINGKKYILVIVDDYSRYTWTLFLRSKDETPEVLKDFLTMIQRNLQAQVIIVRTDRGTYTGPDTYRASIYPEYIPLEDEHEFPAEEQPLPPVDSPTAESPRYVTESDPEEDPEEYEDDETEDGPVDYPMDGGDDGDDDDGDSSRDDANGEDEDDEDEGRRRSTLASPVIPPPSTDITIGARITVRPQASISLPPEAEGAWLHMLIASPTPVPSPLLPSSGCPTQIQTLRIASTQALIDAVTAALPSPPLPPLPPSLYILPPVVCRDDIPDSEQLPRKRLCLSTLGSRYEVGDSSTARPTRGRGIDYGFVSTVDAKERQQGIRDVGYGIRDTWVDPAEAVPEIAPMTMGEVNTRVTELAEVHEHDTQDLYDLLKDAQDSRSRISQRVDLDSQGVDLLMGDSMDGGGGGLCFPIGLGSLDRIESGDSSGSSDPS